MDRQIVYPASIPLDTDLLSGEVNAMVALGFLAQMTVGNGTVVDGLAITQTTVASMTVNVGPGSIAALSTIDATAFGSLGLNAAPLVKLGINTTATSFTLTAPATSGQSVNYLIEATFQESDASAVVLPYYNPSNPAAPYSGPSNSGAAQNTQRLQRVELQLKAGAAAAAGTQTTPAVDTGWVGLYVVTVNYGQTAVTTGNLAGAQLPTAPFVAFKLPQLAPGFSRMAVLTASASWTVPAGVSSVKVRVVGGGGAGGGQGTGAAGSGGGGAGGYAEGVFAVTPGQVIAATVGAGAAGAIAPGANGGTTSFGSLLSATGGGGGTAGGTANAAGAQGGLGVGGLLNCFGGYGTDGQAQSGVIFGGNGGASAFGGGGRGSAGGGTPANGAAPGSGGGGVYGSGTALAGGNGAAGVIILEY